MIRKDPSWDTLIGINCIQELLHHAPDRIVKIWAIKNEDRSQRKEELLQLIQKEKIPLQWVPKEQLFSYAGSESHQGFLAFIKKRVYLELPDFIQNLPDKTILLALDSIYDPQNFGTLLRSAECFGVSGVIWSKNRGAEITPVVAKASSGATELVPLLRVSNLATTLQTLKKEGFALVAADSDPNAQSLYDVQFPERMVLIMGSEGEGIQPLIKKMCDQIIFIPMQGKISSLNVAQAAAVCLSHYLSLAR